MEKTTSIPRKVFEVIIGSRTYDVYDIEGREHEGLNGEPKTWWIYYADRLPNGTLPPADSSSFEPWSKSLNRTLWDIRFKEYNSAKEKWNSTNFRHGLQCEMHCNDKLVYTFGTFDLSFAMAKAQYLIVHMSEHPYNFFDTEKENGRKIYFYGLPATVKPSSAYPGEISIIPDYEAGVSKKDWWNIYNMRKKPVTGEEDKEWEEIESDDNREYERSDSINWGDALSDGNINWFRK